jgi:hypothetical protein
MTPDELTELLAERLNEIAPPGFQILAGDGMLHYSAVGTTRAAGGATTFVTDNLDASLPLPERVRQVGELALGEFQDYVDETTTQPWPGSGGVPPAHAEVRGSQLYLWYGPAEAPVTECRPISIGS